MYSKSISAVSGSLLLFVFDLFVHGNPWYMIMLGCGVPVKKTTLRIACTFLFGKSPSVHGYIGCAPRALAGNVFCHLTRKLRDVVALDVFKCVYVCSRLQHTNAKMYRSPCGVR